MIIVIYLWWLAILWTYTELFARPFDDWKNTLLYIGAGILVIARSVAAKQSSAGKRDCHSSDIVFKGILISYLLICIASIVVAPSGRYEGLLELARLILWAGLTWVFAQSSSRTWLWLMRITVVSAAAMGLLTWLQTRGAGIWPYSGNFMAPIGHISYYGDFMALSLVMAMGVMFQHVILRTTSEGSKKQILRAATDDKRGKTQSDKKRGAQNDKIGVPIVYILPMFLIDLGLALSATRASLVGVIAGLLLAIPLVGYATRSFKKMTIIALIGAINLGIIFSLPIQSLRGESASARLQQVFNLSQATIEATSSGRWHTYVTSTHMAMERPLLGWGLGTFRFTYPEFANRNAPDSLVSTTVWYMHPHNEALHQAVELGFPGAVLFLLGFAYLFYRGIKSLDPRHRGDDDTNGAILITALCGLTAAFISWQLSTNFLFPISRLMTALFAGIVWKYQTVRPEPVEGRSWFDRSTSSRLATNGKWNISVLVIMSLATLLITAYQISLICLNARQRTASGASARSYTDWAVHLAPGAFDPLFASAALALSTEPPDKAAPAITSLYESYPYVPAVLYMAGVLHASQGDIPEGRRLLQHAIANDPGNGAAKQLLDQLPPQN